jgi:uncharacterized protein
VFSVECLEGESKKEQEKTMPAAMEFPRFKEIQLEDRDVVQEILWQYQPQTSEMTFTNFFIWRSCYGFQWSRFKDWLLFICTAEPQGPYGFPPVGPPLRKEVVRHFLKWLGEQGGKNPRIERADLRLAEELKGSEELVIEPVRDHFDYIYRGQDLIQLAGRKYHGKRNHISKLLRSHAFTYAALEEKHVAGCLELSGRWCLPHRCAEDLSLSHEWDAVREGLANFRELKLQGGVLLEGDKVQAFTLGERLNREMAVVHVEKADPEIPELYTLINQQFCEHAWQEMGYINREQDLGDPGLRQAKLSYFPDRFSEKFQIRLRQE